MVRHAFSSCSVDGHILLVDCAHEMQQMRLRGPSTQSELVSREMVC